MMKIFKKSYIHILCLQLLVTSCVPEIQRRENSRGEVQVSNISVQGDKLRIVGSSLHKVENIRITDKSGTTSDFSIGSQNEGEIIADALSNTLLPLNQILTMTLQSANGASTFTINVDLPDLGASHGQILQYNAITRKWAPANQPTSSVTSVNGKLGAVNLTVDDLYDTDTSGAISGSILKFNGTNWVIGTDEGGSSTNATSIHNRLVSNITPTDGQALVWSSTNSSWVPSTIASGGGGGTGEANTVYSTGGTSIFKQKVGSQLQFKGLSPSSDINITEGSNSLGLQISTANGANQLLRLDSLGRLPALDGSQLTGISGGGGGSGETNTMSTASGASIFKQKSGVDFVMRGILGSSDFVINESTNTVDFQINTANGANQLLRLDSSGRLPALDGSLLTGIAAGGGDTTLQSRDVSAAAPTNGQALLWNDVSQQWEPATITAGGAGGEVNTASSAGGEAIYQNKVGSNLVFKGLSNTTDISLTGNANDIQIGINTSNGAGQILRLDSFGRLPALDGSLLTGIAASASGDAVSLQTRDISSTAPTDGQVLTWNNSVSEWEPQTLAAASSDATTLQTRNVATTAPADGQALVWNNGTSQWEPQTIISGGGSGENNTISSAGGVSLFKQKSGVDLILKGLQGSTDFTVSGSTNTVDLQINTSNGANQLLRLDASGRLPAIDGSLLTGIAGGSSDATAIQSRTVSAVAPANGQALLWNSTSSQWEPTTIVTGGAGGEANTASSAGGEGLFQAKVGTNLVFKGLTGGSDITLTGNTNDVQINVTTANAANELLRLDAFGRLPAVDGSQLTGIATSDNTIQSRAVASTAPTDGQALVWNNIASQWEPQTISAGAGGESNTISSVGGASLFKQKTGVDLELKGLTVTSDLAITENVNDVQVGVNTSNGANQLLRLDASGRLPAIDGSQLTGIAAAGEVNTASNLGGSYGVFAQKNGSELQFKGFNFSTDFSISDVGDYYDITLLTSNAGGELLRLELDGKLPSLDATNLYNLPASDTTLQSRSVSPNPPSNGQVLTWNGTFSEWEPADLTVSGDDLGSHMATQNFQIGANYISYSGLDEGLYVNLGGNVGIGTNTPAADLHISDSHAEMKIQDSNVGISSEVNFTLLADGSEAGFALLNSNYDWAADFPDASWSDVMLFHSAPETANGMRMHAFAGDINLSVGDAILTDVLNVNGTNGNVGILTTTPSGSFALDVNGSVRGTAAFDSTSDERLKKKVTSISSEISILDKLSLLDGVYFEWRKDEFPQKNFKEGRDIGVIAQNVEKVFPEAVSRDENGYLSVAYAKLVAPLIEAVKSLFSISKDQGRDIASLEARTKKLEEENQMLKQALCEMNPKAKICQSKQSK
ncbi:tail fiber domain-containing protein [Halobacteriovorax sp. XZX-3]|uniref:tail fiber domain-containing protein n=1 Tax=unclassified Halobacteriovorax TaxID=2639665 RepID=UPI00372199DC